MLRYAEVRVGGGAPLGCASCSPRSASAYDPSADVLARIAAVTKSWRGVPGPNVVLSGPEPFLHPELPALVAACVTGGAERVCIETDGGALAVGGNAEGALRSGVRQLRVRMLSAVEPAADGLTGRPGLHRAAGDGVRAFLAAAVQRDLAVAVTVVIPVCGHNLETLPATIGALASWGIHAVRLESSGPLPDLAAVHLAATCDTGMVNRLWVETDGLLPLPESHRLHAVPEVSPDG